MALDKLQYDRERTRLGDELKSLRRSKRVTGITLAELTKISQSKLSKIETGALIPSTDDLRTILKFLKASRSDTTRFVEWARDLRTELVSWRSKHRKGLATTQNEIAELEKEAKRVRIFQTATIPGLLQIPPYARRVLELANLSRQLDIEAAVAARMHRQQILYESEREFEFVITEAAALSRFCDPGIAINQLERIRFLFGLQNVRVGFLPNRLLLPQVALNSFVIYDSHKAVIEILTDEISIIDRVYVAIYNRTFEEFASKAVFGTDADGILDEWKRLLLTYTVGSSSAPITAISSI